MAKIHELPVAGVVQATDWLVISQGGRTRKVGALAVTGPQGPQGPTGATGPKGDTGATGPAGTTSWVGITDKPTTLSGFGITDAEPTIAAASTAPTGKYWRGDKSWQDFATNVRAATLAGLSTATNAVIAAGDTVLSALGKLQAQISEKFDKSGGVISGNVSVVAPVPAWGVAAIAATGAKAGSLWSNGISGGVLHNAYFAAGYIPTYISAGYAAHFGFNMSGAGGAALFVAPSGSAGAAVTFTEALTANSAGQITINSGLSFGYGAGSGGTATQTGSRTSGVALNKPSGQITLVSAAGTTAWQSFTVTNSTVASTDTPIVAQISGADLYEIHVTAVATGSFRLSFRTTGGTTTEQPVFKFEILKGATS